MATVKKIFNKDDDTKYQLWFLCPACNAYHAINQEWKFNEDYDKPSIEPSIRVNGSNNNGVFECHTWITKGKVKFFSDCSHEMARKQWIDLPEIDENYFKA